ncbi:MAG: TonB-dependent receptor plug domain-containing protein [Opitutales bacterium]
MNHRQKILISSACLLAGALWAEEPAADADDKSSGQDKSIYELEDFTVVSTGTRTERLIQEAPVKTELVLTEDFDDYNVRSLRDAFKLIPTARFENDCQNCRLNNIQLLGLSTDYTAILFDGAPLYSGLAKVYGADLFPAIFIDRIEVVKGGSSVLYGPEAMAGVVNLITAEPFQSGFESEAGYSTVLGDTADWEASFRGDYVDPAGRFSLSAYGLHADEESVDMSDDGFSDIPEYENTIFGLQGWWHPSGQATLKANYQYMDQTHRGGDRLDLPEEQARVAESLAHEIHLAQVNWKQQVHPDFDYSLGASLIHLERESFYGARAVSEDNAYDAYRDDGGAEDKDDWLDDNQDLVDQAARNIWGFTENEVYYLESQFNHYLGAHTLSYGAQYRYEDLTDGPLYAGSAAPTTEDDFANIGFFIQDQWAITPELELVPGIRVDKHDNVDDSILSPRLAARYFATDELTLRASWSTGFNAPGAFNEDKHIGVNQGGAIFLRNEPGLEEESSQTFSLGGEYRPNAMDELLTLHSQVHYTILQNTFEIDDEDATDWLRINGPDADIFVWENNLNWLISPHLRLDAGFSFIHARYEERIDRVTGLSSDEFLKRPEWTGHLAISYENDDLFDAHALLDYTGEMLAVGEDADIWRRTDPFYVVDVGVSKNFDGIPGVDRLTVSLGIENLFDERQGDLQNGENRDPTYLYGPAQPRTFYVRVGGKW